MSEWKEVRLGEVCDIKGGKRLPKGCLLTSTPTKHPYIKIKDIIGLKYVNLNSSFEYLNEEVYSQIAHYTVNAGDIVISIVGSVGMISIIGNSLDHANLTENCVKLINLKDVEPEYLYYYLYSKKGQDQINLQIVGAVQPKLPIKNIREIKLSLPPLEEQRRIAEILSSLDSKIECNNKICKNLEEQAQALFKNWFVDFAPFKEGKFIDSELGLIPEGWRVGTLGEIADITMGQSPAGSSYNDKGEGIIFYQGRTEFGFRYPSIRLYTTEPKRYAEPLSTLLSVRAPVGDINVAIEKCCIGRGLASIKSKGNYNSYIYYLLSSLKRQLDVYNGEGTVFGSINKNTLNELKIVIPTDELIKQFDNIASAIDNKLLEAYKESSRLAQLRDTLLPKLMSGQIKV